MCDLRKVDIKCDDPYPFCLTAQCVSAWVKGCQVDGCASRNVQTEGCCGSECLFICFPLSLVADFAMFFPFLAFCGVKKCVNCAKSDTTEVTVTTQPSAKPVVEVFGPSD